MSQDWITIRRRKRGGFTDSVEQKDKGGDGIWDGIREESKERERGAEEEPKRRISSESLLALLRKRMEMKLNQEMADLLCHFPRHTFRSIESRRVFPTPSQVTQIEKYFTVRLKTDVPLSDNEES